jgi:hypothetical protein
MNNLPAFVVAGTTAALLTLFDLDRTFYIPSKLPSRLALRAWWWGFVLANGLLAASLYAVLGDLEILQRVHPLLRAMLIGIGYLAFIRAKLTTFNLKGTDVPAGIEVFYEGAKGYVYRRINRIAKVARFTETTQMAKETPLEDLLSRARLSIEQDVLLDPSDKRAAKAWLLRVVQDDHATAPEKALALADFILSGQKSSDVA